MVPLAKIRNGGAGLGFGVDQIRLHTSQIYTLACLPWFLAALAGTHTVLLVPETGTALGVLKVCHSCVLLSPEGVCQHMLILQGFPVALETKEVAKPTWPHTHAAHSTRQGAEDWCPAKGVFVIPALGSIARPFHFAQHCYQNVWIRFMK